MKVAIYARVSTEEQARHGESIAAQLDALRKWAMDNHHIVIGEYVDAGISGRKPASKRPELQRLLCDIDKIQLVVFTKLDRWFRNVREYHKVQEVLEAHGVSWQTILENYDTHTTDGKFRVSIMLAVAEQEADRTSDRIKTVFEYKRQRGEYTSGKLPLGFELIDKKMCPNAQITTVQEIFDCFISTKSSTRAMLRAREIGVNLTWQSIRRLIKNPAYKDYIKGYDLAQELFLTRSVRQNQTNKIYIFSGLIFCEECQLSMYGQTSNYSVLYYCRNARANRKCIHRNGASEKIVEQYLVENIVSSLDEKRIRVEREKKVKKPPIDRAEIKRKLERLADLYVDGIITKEKLLKDRAALKAKLAEPESEPDVDYGAAIDAVKSAREIYADYTRERKQQFWRKLVAKITVNSENTVHFELRQRLSI